VSVAARRIDPGKGRISDRGTDRQAAEMRLLADAGAGSTSAFRVLVGRYLPPLVALSRRMLGDDAEAEDVAQETLLRLWRNARTVEVGASGLQPWLSRVAANMCLDRIRARRRGAAPTDRLPDVPEPARQHRALEEARLAARVDQALQRLPERQRLAMVLFHYQGLSQNEAAAILEIGTEALESLLARARRALKADLAGEWKALLPDGDTSVTGRPAIDDEEM
jgi:RNA polymerase sigma-70 factor (ECF subfamily)